MSIQLGECKPYGECFSSASATEAMKAFRFAPQAERKTTVCNRESPWLQHGSRSPTRDACEPVVPRRLLVAQIAHYKTPEGVLELNGDGIEMAMERRIQLFFQQAIMCRGMSAFTFREAKTDSQIGTAKQFMMDKRGNKTKWKREGAHSSTLPTLIAHAKDGSVRDLVYLKGSSYYAQQNSVIGADEKVNGADEIVDKKFRKTATKIINLVASKNLDPIAATRKFLRKLDAQVEETREALEDEDGRKAVLGCYHQKIQAVMQSAQEDSFFDQLLSLQLEDKPDAIRQAAFQKRYDMMRFGEMIESRIGKRLADFAMGDHEKCRLEDILLKRFGETEERQTLAKLFAKTPVYVERAELTKLRCRTKKANLTTKYEEELKVLKDLKKQRNNLKNELRYQKKIDKLTTKYEKDKKDLKKEEQHETSIAKLTTKHKTALDVLCRGLRADFRELRAAEFTYRSGAFKDIRTAYKWTQKGFAAKYEEETGEAISQSWVSRVEHLARPIIRNRIYATPLRDRRRLITYHEAINAAQTFDIDSAVLLPALFASQY